jgi:hypothetical protein
MIHDIKYGFRMLLKKPAFTLIAVLSLALGIGANTAIFSLLDAVLLKSLPVQQPDRLVLFGKGESQGLTNDFPDGSCDLFSYPFYRQVQQRSDVFSGVASLLSIEWTVHGFVNYGASDIEQLKVQLVSGTYFPVRPCRCCRQLVLVDATVGSGSERGRQDDHDRRRGVHDRRGRTARVLWHYSWQRA